MTTASVEQAVEAAMNLSNGTGAHGAIGTAGQALRSFMRIGEHVPPYWSRTRDVALHNFWRDGGYLSGIMGAASAKLTNIPLRVEARNQTITAHVNQAYEMSERINFSSEFGQGLYTSISRFTQDWLGQDNGGFIEMIGAGKKDGPIVGPVVSTRHIDSQTCTRTGDPEFPVNVHENGKVYKLHRTRVVFSALQSSPEKGLNGVGYCAVSKSIEIAHALHTMVNYRNEKMGSRPKSMMLVGRGIAGTELMTAFAVADQIMDSLGLNNYSQIVAVGGGRDVAVDKIDLNDFEPFNEETQLTLGMYYLALAWGLEPAEIFPVKGATVAGEQVSLQRSRGKLPTIYTMDVVTQMGYKMLPRHLRLIAQHTDSIEEHQTAVIDDIRARTSHRNLESGATTKLAERKRMLETGSLTREQYIMMNLHDGFLEDGTPIGQLFYKEQYNDLLVIDRSYLVPSINMGSERAVREAIQINRQLVYYQLANTSGPAWERARHAGAALDWAESLYMSDEEAMGPPVPSVNLEDGGLVDGTTKQLEVN